jgi:hypothetical protein
MSLCRRGEQLSVFDAALLAIFPMSADGLSSSIIRANGMPSRMTFVSYVEVLASV